MVGAGMLIAVLPVTRSRKRHEPPPKTEYTRVTRTSGLHWLLTFTVREVTLLVNMNSAGALMKGTPRESASTCSETKFVRLQSPAPRVNA